MGNLVLGASGMVGSYIASHLAEDDVITATRNPFGHPNWVRADLTRPGQLDLPRAGTVFCATHARLFANAASSILKCKPKRIIVISSTSAVTKLDSSDEGERRSTQELIEAERSIIRVCASANVEWTILRPTMIYKEGRDRNVTQIYRIIKRLRFMPLYGDASGLRQPVHAEDLALGAIEAAKSPAAANKIYSTSGIETITYREMVGRIFDGMAMPRRMVNLPPAIWVSAFTLARWLYPNITAAMGERMMKDLAFDSSEAVTDFGWTTRPFAPSFRSLG